MGKVRSPVLGFNHNIRHRGWLFHVQTEDSGVANPHIFTHLFHDGVIIVSKKMVYDSNSDVDVVKSLMQAQHKSVLKGLKGGEYDVKIKKYLGDAPPEAIEVVSPPDAAPTASTPAAAAASTPAAASPSSIPPASVPATPVPDDDPDRLDLPRAATPMPDTWRTSTPPESEVGVAADAPAGETLPRGSGPTDEQKSARQTGEHAARSTGSWVVSRPGQKERPFEKGGANQAGDEGGGRQRPLTPPVHSVSEDDAPAFTPRSKGRPTPQAMDARREPSNPGDARREPSNPGDGRSPSGSQRVVARPSRTPSKPDALPPGRAPAASDRRIPPSPDRRGTPVAGVPSSPPAGQARAMPAAGRAAAKPPESAVVVARPAVVIGAPPTVIGGNAQTSAAGRRPQAHARESLNNQSIDNIFGQDLISEKSLDEVIMAYLSEDSTDD